eukprot:TRINITY_DN12698_c0_g1_i1.p1 TRINITY_DN12698_c0_g1~~TRINITY_DN12698_c0_g1_i1.p1  ORF type:complete len:494 (+),score=32.04 TRINITY_DN12698_c0_g1_i1:233-1714(+)
MSGSSHSSGSPCPAGASRVVGGQADVGNSGASYPIVEGIDPGSSAASASGRIGTVAESTPRVARPRENLPGAEASRKAAADDGANSGRAGSANAQTPSAGQGSENDAGQTADGSAGPSAKKAPSVVDTDAFLCEVCGHCVREPFTLGCEHHVVCAQCVPHLRPTVCRVPRSYDHHRDDVTPNHPLAHVLATLPSTVAGESPITCPICLSPFADPLTLGCRQHAVCRGCCASMAAAGVDRCPLCRRAALPATRNRPLAAVVADVLKAAVMLDGEVESGVRLLAAELRSRCRHHSADVLPCHWTGTLAEVAAHEEVCNRRCFDCVACGTARVPREEAHRHRPRPCGRCGEATHECRIADHRDQCTDPCAPCGRCGVLVERSPAAVAAHDARCTAHERRTVWCAYCAEAHPAHQAAEHAARCEMRCRACERCGEAVPPGDEARHRTTCPTGQCGRCGQRWFTPVERRWHDGICHDPRPRGVGWWRRIFRRRQGSRV